MNDDEHEFEEYLRGFKPVLPPPLPLTARRSYGPRRIAAAAVAAAVVGVLSWLAIARQPKRARDLDPRAEKSSGVVSVAAISARTLTRIALEDQRLFDARMDRNAPVVMPCCQGPQSSLAALAKE
jgi:hypothetical protein